MKVNQPTHFLGGKDCQFTLKGRKLTEMRRAELRGIARALKVDAAPELTKNDLVKRLIGRLSALGVEGEIASVSENV